MCKGGSQREYNRFVTTLKKLPKYTTPQRRSGDTAMRSANQAHATHEGMCYCVGMSGQRGFGQLHKLKAPEGASMTEEHMLRFVRSFLGDMASVVGRILPEVSADMTQVVSGQACEGMKPFWGEDMVLINLS